MAKQYYSIQEAQDKLGMSEEEVKALVRDGQLREFRDGGQVRFKGEEVENLAENLATLSGSLGGTSGELVLEPADETSMGLTGSDMLTLDEADRTEADATIVDDKKEDTVITSVGISVFDDEEVPESDPGAKTVMQERDESGSMAVDTLSASGTGSGLLDLTRESDDTSLGAELLDEIYSEDQEAGMPEMGDATRAGLDSAADASGVSAQPEEVFQPQTQAQPEVQQQPAMAAGPRIVADEGGPLEMGLSGAMFGCILTLAVAGIAVSANMQSVFPSFLDSVYQNLPIYGGVFAGVTGVCFGVGFFLGKRSLR